MPSLREFRQTVHHLAQRFVKDIEVYQSHRYDEAKLRLQFLNPFFESLGWDVTNEGGQPPHLCDVVVSRFSVKWKASVFR